jgi:hypothetical protein
MTKRLYKRILLFSGLTVLIGAAVTYAYAVPTLISDTYLEKFYDKLHALDAALIRTAHTANLSQFANPDVSLQDRLNQTADASKRVAEARVALKTFSDDISYIPQLPGLGWYGDYQEALVKRAQGLRIVVQSREELDQYESLLAFLTAYTPLQRDVDDRLARIESVEDFDTMQGQGPDVARAAAGIRADADTLRRLTVPKDYEQLKTEALVTFEQAAKGFDHLAYGLDIAVASEIDAADAEIAAASLKNKTADKNLLVTLTDTSPIFVRLTELPEKIDYAER